jgi:hypothetical protein
MNLKEIKSIKLSLMLKDSEINEESKANYLKQITGTLIVPKDFPKTEDAFSQILSQIYNSLLEENKNDVDSLGIWIELKDSTILENAILLNTLQSITEYSQNNLNIVFEFFKMTLDNYDQQ